MVETFLREWGSPQFGEKMLNDDDDDDDRAKFMRLQIPMKTCFVNTMEWWTSSADEGSLLVDLKVWDNWRLFGPHQIDFISSWRSG